MVAEAPGRCVSCRHWNPDQASWLVAFAYGLELMAGRGRCAAFSFEFGSFAPQPTDPAIGVSWGDDAEVMTRPDFGCLAWEARAGAGPIFWPAVQGHESTEADGEASENEDAGDGR